MNKAAIILSVSFLLGTGFLGFQTYRIANSLEYGEAQVKKVQPIIDLSGRKARELVNRLEAGY